jgi:hypothetical protein
MYGSKMLDRDLAEYELANGECFFIPWNSSDKLSYPKVSLKKYGRRPIQLVGKNLNLNWHFAIEGNAFFHPINAFAISYHVVFTEDGILVDKTALAKKKFSKALV